MSNQNSNQQPLTKDDIRDIKHYTQLQTIFREPRGHHEKINDPAVLKTLLRILTKKPVTQYITPYITRYKESHQIEGSNRDLINNIDGRIPKDATPETVVSKNDTIYKVKRALVNQIIPVLLMVCCIILMYCTHIFTGLSTFADAMIYIILGLFGIWMIFYIRHLINEDDPKMVAPGILFNLASSTMDSEFKVRAPYFYSLRYL
jgi:hypothetical protein